MPVKEYNAIVDQVKFELGGIACRCRDIYLEDPHAYDGYIPTRMLDATNDFYNFVMDSYTVFKREDMTTLTAAYKMYRTYCEEANVPHVVKRTIFRDELKNYFREYRDDRTSKMLLYRLFS